MNALGKTYAVVLGTVFATVANQTAQAQGFIEIETVPAIIAVGLGSAPDYRGSDDNAFGIFPYFRYQFLGQERYVQLLANELSLNLLNSSKFRFGPVLNYHFGRDDDIEDDVVKRMREIDDTVEAGVFGDMVWRDPANPRNRFIVGASVLQDIGDESDGWRARLSARWWRQVSRAFDLQLGAGLIYADDDYNDTYFGVNADNVGTSGLPLFTADSGVNEYYLTVGGMMYLSKTWVAGAGLRASKLAGDAKDSPIVEDRGDDTQLIFGVALGYMWR